MLQDGVWKLTAGDIRSYDLARAVKAHDLHAHGARPAGLHLVFMSEQVYTRFPSTVIEVALDQDSQHCALPSVDWYMSAGLHSTCHLSNGTHHSPRRLSSSL